MHDTYLLTYLSRVSDGWLYHIAILSKLYGYTALVEHC